MLKGSRVLGGKGPWSSHFTESTDTLILFGLSFLFCPPFRLFITCKLLRANLLSNMGLKIRLLDSVLSLLGSNTLGYYPPCSK